MSAAAPVLAGVAAATALSPVRTAMSQRELSAKPLRWLLVGIPVGTVWSEEAAYRAGLGSVAADAFGFAGGRLVSLFAELRHRLLKAQICLRKVFGHAVSDAEILREVEASQRIAGICGTFHCRCSVRTLSFGLATFPEGETREPTTSPRRESVAW